MLFDSSFRSFNSDWLEKKRQIPKQLLVSFLQFCSKSFYISRNVWFLFSTIQVSLGTAPWWLFQFIVLFGFSDSFLRLHHSWWKWCSLMKDRSTHPLDTFTFNVTLFIAFAEHFFYAHTHTLIRNWVDISIFVLTKMGSTSILFQSMGLNDNETLERQMKILKIESPLFASSLCADSWHSC